MNEEAGQGRGLWVRRRVRGGGMGEEVGQGRGRG